MELPGLLLEQSVKEGKIYFFRDNCPIGVPGHLHICIKAHNKIFIFLSCTSQMATIRRYTELTGISLDTYPCFPKDNINKFEAAFTFVDCNDVVECSAKEFSMYLKDGFVIPLDGVIDAAGMKSIAKGVKLSKMVAKEIKDLF